MTFRTATTRGALTAMVLASVALAPLGGLAAAQDAPSLAGSVLGTPEQRAAEDRLLSLLADPDVKAAQASVRAELQADPASQTPDGAARLDHAIAEWTTSLILRELSADPARPAILWAVDNTPHTWFGHTVPGAGVAGDNPDHIYRGTFLDGAGRYEILGQVVAGHRPAQFSFEVTRGLPGKLVLQQQTAGHADMGGQIAMRTDRDLQVAPDGSFRITIGGPDDGPNHLASAPGPLSLNIRDVLSDWTQRPNRLVIRRLDTVDAKPRTDAEIRDQVLQDLPGYVHFWAGFKNTWFGGLKPNTIVGPIPRDGNWGFLAAGRYQLAPGEAVVITTTRGAARYNGIQITDPWMIAPDGKAHQTSVNTAQARQNPDGGYTYVLSPEDPGVANWVDTAGLHDGYVLLRWQGFPVGADSAGLLGSFRVVKIADIAAGGLPGVPRLSDVERRQQFAKRAEQYAGRLGE